MHASCALGGSVYVFCGSHSAIEKFDNSTPEEPWKTIQTDSDSLKDRIRPLACPINGHEILIFGGFIPFLGTNCEGQIWKYDVEAEKGFEIVRTFDSSSDVQYCMGYDN